MQVWSCFVKPGGRRTEHAASAGPSPSASSQNPHPMLHALSALFVGQSHGAASTRLLRACLPCHCSPCFTPCPLPGRPLHAPPCIHAGEHSARHAAGQGGRLGPPNTVLRMPLHHLPPMAGERVAIRPNRAMPEQEKWVWILDMAGYSRANSPPLSVSLATVKPATVMHLAFS